MKKVLHIAIYIIAILAVRNSYAQVPKITYTDVNSFTLGVPITPLKPTQLGGAVPATVFCQLSTFAGSGAAGAANGNGTAASFKAPRDIKFDAAGNLYVADAGNNMIRKISPNGDVVTIAGTGASGFADGLALAATFNGPSGLALDKLGNIFIADRNNHLIRQINAAGVVSSLAGKPGVSGSANSQGTFATFNLPTGLAVDKNGGLYVTDYGNNLIRHVGLDGTASTVAGDKTSGWVDGKGINAKLNAPAAAWYGANGLFYMGDDSHIRTVDYDDNVVTIAGSFFSGTFDGLGKSARFSIPSGIVGDAAGTLFIADYGSSLIRRYSTDDFVTNLASAGLNGPAGLDIDNQGNLYIADEKNNVIKKMVTTGYYIEPALPAGLVFDSRTGEISGTPTQTIQASNYSVIAYNAAGRGSYSFSLEVRESQLKTQVITFGPLADGTVGDQDIAPGATSTNNTIPITYTSSDFSVATIANGKIHLVGAGKATITAYQKGSITYAEATPVPREITVFPEPDFAKPTVEAMPGPFNFALDQFGTYTVTAAQLAKITPGPQTPPLTITVRPASVFTCDDIGTQSVTVGAGYGPDPADPLNAELNEPSSISYDKSSGNIYISDQGNYRIRRYGTDIRLTTLAGGVADYRDGTGLNAGFSRGLLSLDNDAMGNTFVCDVFFNYVRKITPDGVTTTFATNALKAANGGATFTPESIAVDRFNNVFVADKVNIYKVSPDGSTATAFAGGSFKGIVGLTFGPDGNMYVSGNSLGSGSAVYKITPDRVVSVIYSSPSVSNFTRLVVDSKGNIFIASSYPNIYKLTQDGTLSVFAGGQEGFADGTGSHAKFHNPQGIAIGPNDNLYIADADNHVIRQISPTGKVITIAGNNKAGVVDNTNKSNAEKVTVQVNILSLLAFTTTQGNAEIPAAASCPANLPDYAKDARATSTCANKITIVQSPAAGAPLYIGQPVTVTLTATDNIGQTKDQTFTVSAVPLPKPTVTIAPKSSVNCDGGPITFTAQIQGEGKAPTYNWLVNGVSASSVGREYTSNTLKTGDKVTCVVTNHDYCEPVASDPSAAYTVSTDPSVATSVTVAASTTDAICPGVAITFTANPGNVQAANLAPTYQWKVNGNPKGSNSATFTTSSLINGDVVTCEMASNIKCAINPIVQSLPITVHVKTDKECAIYVPTAFTPNGDGTNDSWEIPELNSFPGCDFSIFNRYGKVIYHAVGYSKPWDGVYKGAKLPAGTYYFIIDLKTGSAPLSGPVTIIR